MDTPDIKAGKYYNLKLLCVLRKDKLIAFETPAGGYMLLRQCDLECVSPITPSEPPTSVGPAPKYDPCRLFKKGDKVRVVEWNGRDIARVGQIGYVVSDERNSKVELAIDGWTKDVYYPACHLELVTPVEELCPYSVRHNDAHAAYSIYGPYGLSAVNYFYGDRYPYSKHSAEAAAYAECDRLNAAHRKEQQ